jgi:hypothetical protein
MHQITMRGVQFQPFAPRRQRPLRRRDKFLLHTGDFLQAHRARNLGQVTAKGQRAGGNDWPAAVLVRQMGAPFPWARGGGFAARVRDLNPRHRPMLFQKTIDAGHRLDVLVRPDAGITGRDAAFR